MGGEVISKLQSRQGSNFIATLLILIDAYFINSI